MKVELDVTEATVVRLDHGPDLVSLKTTSSSPIWPFDDWGCWKTEVARGTAEEFLARCFPGLPYRVLPERKETR